ncbi:lysophospholipid acyltransferase family protein [Thauera sp. WH-1]|uniref:lysophospholipid acyltransferase family protein n=1 Tax=Thauera sp. WH-1 TaxID=3398230 RepID=UPI0039FBEA49
MSRLVIALIWLLHWLPLTLQARIGSGFGLLLYGVVAPRRKVALTNLRLCFPELSEGERRALARRNFAYIGRSMLERGLAWWASPARLRRLVRIDGLERLNALRAEGRPVILLTPHFLGIDVAGTRLSMEGEFITVYSPQKDKVFDYWLKHGRSRFNDQVVLSRHEGVRATVKAMKSGRPFYYLPDLDYGRKESIFVPFFGVPAATITGLPRLARLAGAAVMPCVSRILPGGAGYVLELGAPWADYPSADVEADTVRMNTWLEGVVRSMPEQYYWVHRRFKTRPEGEARIY